MGGAQFGQFSGKLDGLEMGVVQRGKAETDQVRGAEIGDDPRSGQVRHQLLSARKPKRHMASTVIRVLR